MRYVLVVKIKKIIAHPGEMKSHSRERNGRVTFITRIIFRSGTLLKNDCNNLGQEKRKNKV